MNQPTIDSLIDNSGIRPGDSVWLKVLMLGLVDPHVIYLGRDEYYVSWFVGKMDEGMAYLTQEQLNYLIANHQGFRLNRLVAEEGQWTQVIRRMQGRMDQHTFNLILRNSEAYKAEVALNHHNFKWKHVALGAGIGLTAVGRAALGGKLLQKWLQDRDKK